MTFPETLVLLWSFAHQNLIIAGCSALTAFARYPEITVRKSEVLEASVEHPQVHVHWEGVSPDFISSSFVLKLHSSIITTNNLPQKKASPNLLNVCG